MSKIRFLCTLVDPPGPLKYTSAVVFINANCNFQNIYFFFSDAERHKQNLEENKNKVESSLQGKLAERRQKRAMKNVEEKEKSVLV